MSSNIYINQVNQYLPLLKSLYDTVRFIDPLKNRVIDFQETGFVETNENCFNCLCRTSQCDNCVSFNAYKLNSSLIKFVNSSDSIFLVTAIPIENADTPIVLELINDVTTSLFFDSVGHVNVQKELEAVWQLDNMVIKDQLTSLHNRRFVDSRLPVDVLNAKVKNNPISVLFIDIDNFKQINDEFGHDVGDIALQEASAVFINAVRAEIDWAARYGGDEFLICLNHSEENTARIIAERICANIEKIAILVDGKYLRFTVSIGAHTMHKQKLSATEIIKIADQNMYTSKSQGKNKITISAN